jgi:hypothetical protein
MIAGNSSKENLPTGTKFGSFFGGGLASSETEAAQVLAKGGTATSLYVRTSGAPGSGNSWTFTIFKNGSAEAGLSCTVSDDATSCSDTAGSVSYSAGDTVSIRIVGTSSPAAGKTASWALEYA